MMPVPLVTLEFNGKTIAAKDVHSAYMSALQFGYAKLVTTAEHTAALQLTKST
jgi:nitroimidazol reductase NimA-like FMN-containing flavoprotein (pyridoxamine 5'-phosphate oxidase superfamily)